MTQPPPPGEGYPQDPAAPGPSYPSSPPPTPPAAGPPQPGTQPGSVPPPPPPGGYQQQPGYQAAPGSVPPPPAGYQQNPAGYQQNQPSPAAGFDPASVSKSNWITLGIGFLMVIFGFFGWQSASGGGFSISIGGWNGWWVIIQLILLAVLIIKAVQVFTGNLRKEIPPIALVGAAALLVLLYLIALIQCFAQGESGLGFSVGPGFGIWACLILSIGFAYFLALGAQKDGVQLPFKVPGNL